MVDFFYQPQVTYINTDFLSHKDTETQRNINHLKKLS